MPLVVSDPNMLDQALTGLMDRFTRQLPAHSHIQVEATLAGDQLKLQFQSQPDPSRSPPAGSGRPPLRKSLGKLLSLQPETGSLSLNMDVTKHLFQVLGGKLQVKDDHHKGEVLTVFLPLQRAGSHTGKPF
ncbi:MAG: HAMP domain-containing histidine kinase [Synechococcales cyanobacterium RM1_1_8]|nr:HAMP domain-containing histidine kinase [Synechococcales cyanobacterium RM1_1_8]